jgi:hypothetical protein
MSPKLIAVATAVVALAGGSTAQAQVQYTIQSSQSLQPPAVHALILRGEALNARDGLGSDANAAVRALNLRGAAYNARYVSGPRTHSAGGSPVGWARIGMGAGLTLAASGLLLGFLAARRSRETRAAVA